MGREGKSDIRGQMREFLHHGGSQNSSTFNRGRKWGNRGRKWGSRGTGAESGGVRAKPIF